MRRCICFNHVVGDDVRRNSVEIQRLSPCCELLTILGELLDRSVEIKPGKWPETYAAGVVVALKEREYQRVLRLEAQDAGDVCEDLAVRGKCLRIGGHETLLAKYGINTVSPVFGPGSAGQCCYRTLLYSTSACSARR
ncbi:hypothetical protein [uncultured Brevibacterium sp.]|uniref:hypothetical protein n=1 Tax=uncultured Brevibacterium sp. TaxID=189678 RepID=UPI0034576407